MCKQFEKILAVHCSPAVFGIKASNLINVSIKKIPDIMEQVKNLNDLFNPRINFKILRKSKDNVLILVYQENKLSEALFSKDNNQYLQEYGYSSMNSLDDYINLLSYKIDNCKEFPHEIGVFLGYDLNDIKEFQKGNKNCLLVGYWKVFSEPEKKKLLFDKYNECRDNVFKLLDKGYKLEEIM